MTGEPSQRIPLSLGAKDYATAWNNIAQVREHAYELVDESQSEAAIDKSGLAVAPILVRGLSVTRDDVIMEIGCGVARLGKHIAPSAREWWGLDVSRNMISIAAERTRHLPNVRLFVGNGQDLADVPAASVDKMYCHAVFFHMDKEDMYSYLLDAKRVLKPEGLFYFDVWNICDEAGWLRWQVERKLYKSRSDRPVHRNQFSSPDELRMMLRMAGWHIIQLAETFSLQAVVTHLPESADVGVTLEKLRNRYGRSYEILKYGREDYRTFSRELASRLQQAGIAPEIDITQYV